MDESWYKPFNVCNWWKDKGDLIWKDTLYHFNYWNMLRLGLFIGWQHLLVEKLWYDNTNDARTMFDKEVFHKYFQWFTLAKNMMVMKSWSKIKSFKACYDFGRFISDAYFEQTINTCSKNWQKGFLFNIDYDIL